MLAGTGTWWSSASTSDGAGRRALTCGFAPFRIAGSAVGLQPEIAWHDCYGQVSASDDVIDDILLVGPGDLASLVSAARLAAADSRDLRLAADATRRRPS